ncbi:MAG: N-acetylglucosamine-6-phosphate deacetylase [Blastocatellia bacterium]|jgi:N-acetylglucosamine-6-phosphate deacetylase|nr:N-acetylglucosamine-6-phosphate deacetylase [Blastocatellia bacterium]
MTTVALRNAQVVLPDRKAAGHSVLINNGRIVTCSEETIDADQALDLSGFTLFAGFIDAHIHGAVGIDANNSEAEGLHQVSRFLASNGVTGWLPTLVPDSADNYRKAIQTIEDVMRAQREPNREEVVVGARVLGVHYEGPFVSDQQCGALRSQFFKNFDNVGDLETLPRLAFPGAVHLSTVAPEIEGGIALIGTMTQQDWIVSLGHTRATPAVLDQALAAGASHMTHFMNAMAPLHQRAPGPIAWGLLHDDVSCDIIADGEHIDPLMLQLLVKLKGTTALALISDSIAAAGLGDGDYAIWGETINVKDGRTSNARGSIAGSVITMLDAVRLMLSLGVPEVEVARMAATNPARLLKIEDECGSIAEGKRADLVALDQQGNVRLTIIGGEVAFMSEPPAVAGD